MAEKISGTELRKLLAARAGVREKEANAFLNALNSQIIAALKQDKQVKITGLGTFRLQPVAPRKSVNVQTGEAITLDGYNKLVFSPESSVKELVETVKAVKSKGKKAKPVNEPEDIDPIRKLGEQANEIVDILGELGQDPKQEKSKKEKTKSQEEAPREEVKIPIEEVASPIEYETPPPPQEQVPAPAFPHEVKEEAPQRKEYIPEEPQKKPKKKYHFLRDTLICVVCLLLLLLIGYFFLKNQLSNWIESFVRPTEHQTEIIVAPVSVDTATVSLTPAEEEVVLPEEEGTKTDTEKKEVAAPIYEELITIEPMHEASRLTWMSKRYYGEKKFWVYIYDANRDHIKNPSRILVGTPIRVPKLTAAQRDTTLASTRATLEKLTREAEAACRK